MKNKYIILVDDDPLVLTSLNVQLKNLKNDGYTIENANSGKEAIEVIDKVLSENQNSIPLIITDYQMDDMNGAELLIHLNEKLITTKKILLTGKADIDGIKMIIKNVDLYRYLQKPWDTQDLKLTIKQALNQYSKEQLIHEKEKINAKTHLYLNIINTFSNTIQKSITIDDVLWSVAKNAIAQFGYEDCVIYLFDEDKKHLIQRASHGNKNPKSREILNPIKINIGDGIVGGVAASGVGEIIPDTSKDERYILDDLIRLSEITIPIIHNNEVLGIIDSEHSKKNFFSPDHLELLNTIASMTATKLIQIKYNNELEKHQKHLEKLVKQRTNQLEEAIAKLEVSNIQIKDQNKALEKLALFPEHNPNVVIELNFDYKIMYLNSAAKKSVVIQSFLKLEKTLLEKYIRLLNLTLKNKETGRYRIKEGFYIFDTHYDLNIYIDNELKFIRLYLTDISENIKLQKNLQEHKDSTIDSLNYAKRIQQSILPDMKIMEEYFDDQFIIFKPKDIVSGDFYWANKFKDRILFSLNDCTGHGVPGALMSIMGYDTLNSIITHDNLNFVSDIINLLNHFYIDMREKSQASIWDTMDMMLISYNKENKLLKYTGCKQRLYLIRNNELQVFNTDTYTLGLDRNSTYKHEELQLEKNDKIYLFTDGYVDQFGGENGKKFKYSKFRELLINTSHLSMSKQKKEIENTINNWMQSLSYSHDQIDDISIIGFKV